MKGPINLGVQKLITGYQSYLSPHKGFRCAHHALHGAGSCSDWALDVVNEGGLFRLFKLLPFRFSECRAAYKVLNENAEHQAGPGGAKQGGGNEDLKKNAVCCLSAAPCW